MQLNTLFSAIPKFFSFFQPPFQPKSLPFTLPHPVLHGSNLNNIKSYSTHPLAYPLDIEFSVSTTGAYVFRILLPQPYLISTTLRYGPRISRAALAKPDGYSNLLVLLVLISLILRPKRRSCPIGANPYVGNNLESRNSNTKNLEVRDSALLIISLTVNCCSDPVHQDVNILCDDLSWQDGLPG